MKILENKRYFVLFGMLGFLAGILYANLVSRDYIANMGVFNTYFLEQYQQADINAAEYVWYIIRIRAVPLLFLIAAGEMKVRKAAASLFLLWTCFLGGLLMASAVMKMGMKGLILCLMALVPHAFFYLAGYLILLWYLLAYPMVRWNLSKTVCMILFMLMGILTECYVNPVVMQLFIKTL